MTVYTGNGTTIPFDFNQAITSALRVIAPPVRFGSVMLDTPIGEKARCLTVGTSGSVTVVSVDGVVATIPYVEAGQWFPIVFVQVNTGGTAAGGIMWGA